MKRFEYQVKLFEEPDTDKEMGFLAEAGKEGWSIVGFACLDSNSNPLVQYVLQRELP